MELMGSIVVPAYKRSIRSSAVKKNASNASKLRKLRFKKPSQGLVALSLVIAGLAAHAVSALWFLAHSVILDAKVISREDFLFIGKRHGVTHAEVRFIEPSGAVRTQKIRWQISRPPKGESVSIRCAPSGFVRFRPASLPDIFWLEVFVLGIGSLIALFIGAAVAVKKIKLARQ